MKKLGNTDAELKKNVFYKKKRVIDNVSRIGWKKRNITKATIVHKIFETNLVFM